MMDEIKVLVIANQSFPCYRLRWKDPATGKLVFKSSGVQRTARQKSRREAAKVAGRIQADLNSGRYLSARGITWAEFRERYEDEALSGLAPTTGKKVGGVFNAVESLLPTVKVGRLRDLTAEKISTLQSELRKKDKAESTIAGYLAHLRSALQWAADCGMIPAVPKFKRIRRAKIARATTAMKGRPITGEEFERMLAVVPRVLAGQAKQGKPSPIPDKPKRKPREPQPPRQADPAAVAAWIFYLRGLWWSGLRLEESLQLFWDREDRLHVVDLSAKKPMLRIPAELEKGHKDRELPVAPEFVGLLRSVPEAERKGRVFKLPSHRGAFLKGGRVGVIGVKIGKAAGIKVYTHPKTGKVKCASLHDLRRSFGNRWAELVMPQKLMELMRHESISTTMTFYVGRNAARTADAVWAAYEQKQAAKGAILGAIDGKAAPTPTTELDVSAYS